MDTIQIQINALNSKVDSLHQVIENLGSNLTQTLTEIRSENSNGTVRPSYSSGRYGYARSSEALLEHKDVLSDDHTLESSSQSGEKSLAPEIQIQRLTAQLTAAYNRIAALEEQLLAQRIH
jgi:hypothetical protein